MSAKPFSISSMERYWPTKKAAKKELRGIIDKYDFKEHFDVLDRLLFLNLINEHHPKPESKRLPAVAEMYKLPGRNRYGNLVDKNKPGLVLLFKDGTSTDVSWVKCIASTPSPFTQAIKACRVVVQEDINKFYDATGIRTRGMHVHHHIHFEEIVSKWLDVERSLGHKKFDEYPKLVSSPPMSFTGPVFADNDEAERWRVFHNKEASLMLTTKEDNLGKLRVKR